MPNPFSHPVLWGLSATTEVQPWLWLHHNSSAITNFTLPAIPSEEPPSLHLDHMGHLLFVQNPNFRGPHFSESGLLLIENKWRFVGFHSFYVWLLRNWRKMEENENFKLGIFFFLGFLTDQTEIFFVLNETFEKFPD